MPFAAPSESPKPASHSNAAAADQVTSLAWLYFSQWVLSGRSLMVMSTVTEWLWLRPARRCWRRDENPYSKIGE